MRSTVRVYLSGSIKKGRTDNRSAESFWTNDDEEKIRNLVTPKVELLNPAKSPIRRSDYFVNYGCDLYLVDSSDIVLVDLRMEKGIGVGAELMYASFAKRPVIGWIPPNSYYRRDKVEDVFGEDLFDWTHPFAFGLCDIIADSLDQACNHINLMCLGEEFSKTTMKSPEKAIEAFKYAYREFIEND